MSRATLPPYACKHYSPCACKHYSVHQLGWGGVERVAAILANGFAKRKIETELLVCAKGGPGEDELRAIIGENASVHYFRQTQGSRLMDLLKGFTKVGRYLYETKPKIVLSAGNNVSLFSLLLVRLYCPGPTPGAGRDYLSKPPTRSSDPMIVVSSSLYAAHVIHSYSVTVMGCCHCVKKKSPFYESPFPT